MAKELRPYIREYGGGDDRWCWCRQMFTEELWNLLCDRHGREFGFAEYATEDAAWWALAKACNQMGLQKSQTVTKWVLQQVRGPFRVQLLGGGARWIRTSC